MKRLMCLILVGVLTIAGCSSKPQKTEEALRAEIKAELEAEMKAEIEEIQGGQEKVDPVVESTEAEADEEAQAASDEDVETQEDEVVEKRSDVFYVEDLKAGTRVSDKFELTSDYYYTTDGYTLAYGYELEANDVVQASLIYNMEYDFYFLRIDEPVFDKDILVQNPMKESGEELVSMGRESLEVGVNPVKSQISDRAYQAAKNSDTYLVKGQATISHILVDDNEASATYSVVVKEFKFNDQANQIQAGYNFEKIPTLNDICTILGIGISEVVTDEDGGYFRYYSHWANDDIAFEVYHDETVLTGEEKLGSLVIMGGPYTMFGIGCDDRLLESFEKIGQTYQHFYSHHDDAYAKYVYDVDACAFTLNGIGFNDAMVLDETDLVTSMNLYELYD